MLTLPTAVPTGEVLSGLFNPYSSQNKFYSFLLLNIMSDPAVNVFTGSNTLPKYVVEETLKRARTEDGTAIRVTSTSTSTDLAPITSALGTQQDPAETPTVIGLLKNLIANSGSGGGGGGGGGESTTLTVPRIQVYDPLSIGGYTYQWQSPVQVTFTLDNESITSFPDWADYIGFYSMQNGYLGVCKLKDNGSNKIIILEIRAQATPSDPMQGMNLQLNKDYVKIELDEVIDTPTVPLTITFTGWNEDWASSSPQVSYYSSYNYADLIPFVFSLSSFDISGGGGGGGGGSGEAITTYSLTINNTTVNNIAAPTDPSDPTSDEQTLATLGSLHNLGIMRQEQHYFTTMPDLATGGTRNITNDLGLTVPDWANEIILHIKIVDTNNFDTTVTRRCNVSIPIQPADISTTWRGYLNVFHIAIQNAIYSTVYYAGELYIYQNVLGLENATELKLTQATPPTVDYGQSSSSFILEGMEFKGIY